MPKPTASRWKKTSRPESEAPISTLSCMASRPSSPPRSSTRRCPSSRLSRNLELPLGLMPSRQPHRRPSPADHPQPAWGGGSSGGLLPFRTGAASLCGWISSLRPRGEIESSRYTIFCKSLVSPGCGDSFGAIPPFLGSSSKPKAKEARMSTLLVHVKRAPLFLIVVFCLAALSFSYAFAEDAARPLAVTVIGDPDAAVNGRFAVGSASVGSKALTVTGVIDFLGAGTVHNYFTQGAGNNMQINTNVDEANTVADASRSQWKLVLGSNLDWFSIRRSPAGGTYNEDALFFVEGSTGRVGIATVDTANGASIPFTPQARLHVEIASGDAVWGITTATSGGFYGVYGQSNSPAGAGVYGEASATTGGNDGVLGESDSTSGRGVHGDATATTGVNYGVFATSSSPS